MSSDRAERAKVFIYGQLGEVLADIDKDRLLSIMQENPNNHLFKISLNEIMDFLEDLDKLKGIIKAVDKSDIKAHIVGLNDFLTKIKDHKHKANLFREMSRFMKDGMDELSRGSMLLGETEQTGLMEIGEYEED